MSAARMHLLILVAMSAIATMTLSIPTVAAAENTSLCLEDPSESPCPEGQIVNHVHFTAPAVKFLTESVTAKCETLFLGDTLKPIGAPLSIKGKLTYANCEGNAGICTVTETSETSTITLLRVEHETANVTLTDEIHVECLKDFINCYFNGTSLVPTAKGPLLSETTNGEIFAFEQVLNKTKGSICPKTTKLDLSLEPSEALFISEGPPPNPVFKTALCATDEAESTCLEEHKPSTVDFKDSAVEFLTNLVNVKCEGLVSSTSVGEAGEPQQVSVEYQFNSCTNGCVVTEKSGGSKLGFLLEEGEELPEEFASITPEGLKIFIRCEGTIKCTFGPAEGAGDGLGALVTADNGHITFSKDSLGKGEGVLCPTEASLDAL